MPVKLCYLCHVFLQEAAGSTAAKLQIRYKNWAQNEWKGAAAVRRKPLKDLQKALRTLGSKM